MVKRVIWWGREKEEVVMMKASAVVEMTASMWQTGGLCFEILCVRSR
jgi:hypothetical protein